MRDAGMHRGRFITGDHEIHLVLGDQTLRKRAGLVGVAFVVDNRQLDLHLGVADLYPALLVDVFHSGLDPVDASLSEGRIHARLRLNRTHVDLRGLLLFTTGPPKPKHRCMR